MRQKTREFAEKLNLLLSNTMRLKISSPSIEPGDTSPKATELDSAKPNPIIEPVKISGWPMPLPTGPTLPADIKFPNLMPSVNPSHVRIASFEPGIVKLEEGGTGADLRYPQAKLEAALHGERFADVKSVAELYSKLEELKRGNGGQPLTRITLDTHGGPGSIYFANGRDEDAVIIVNNLVEKGLLAQGGKIDFIGCLVAGTSTARDYLRLAAMRNGVTIEANETISAPGIPNFQWVFRPNGSQEKFFGY